MKFPRNARLLRSPFDVAPFVAVFFLLIIFLMLESKSLKESVNLMISASTPQLKTS